MKFKAGDMVTLVVRGAGVTSEEQHTVAHVANGCAWVNDMEFDASTGVWLGESPFGFSFGLLPTPRAQREGP